jgi:cell wall-associated NlpC family hydrolase
MRFQLICALTRKWKFTLMFHWVAAALLLAGCSSLSNRQPDPVFHPGQRGPRVEEVPQPAWGVATVSVACARENPLHKSELGTQVLMGHSVRVWKQSGSWYLVETQDGYRAWLELGTFELFSADSLRCWQNSSLAIVTALETTIHETPAHDSEVVSDTVIGCLVEKLSEAGGWCKVQLPDGRQGYMVAETVELYADWQKSRRPTPDSIEATARRFLGRPYMWGGNSPKALDCSGFTQLVFFLNGIQLPRNASQQAKCGSPVELTPNYSQLRKGDLLFFGRPASRGGPERITHTGIYLGNGNFIHSYDRVHISRLGETSAGSENQRRRPIEARRVLPHLP